MKKICLLFMIISLLIVIIFGCENTIPQANEVDNGQEESEITEAENSPGPAPNSGDGISDGSGWKNNFPEVN